MSSSETIKNEERLKIDVKGVWDEVLKTINLNDKEEKEILNTRWKTIRIFVSSTFKDFQNERDVLVNQIFPDLRSWCERRRLNLIECDLRWGVPEGTANHEILLTCLREIQRCKLLNNHPYFINMIGKRVGWIPLRCELPDEVVEEERVVIGLSVTEMELVQATIKIRNPNALFLSRDSSFLDGIEDEGIKAEFIDPLQPLAHNKIQQLHRIITQYFGEDQIQSYSCQWSQDRTRLQPHHHFKHTVMEFMKERIEIQYPIENSVKEDDFERQQSHQEAFVQRGFNELVAVDVLVEKIEGYLSVGENDGGKMMVIVGGEGSGKTSILSNVVRRFIHGDQKQFMFYHFVGAVPNSKNLHDVIKRLLKQLHYPEIPDERDELLRLCKTVLSASYHQERIVIIIDALEQLEEDEGGGERGGAMLSSWLPFKLGTNVRVLMSVTEDFKINLIPQEAFIFERLSDLSLSQKGSLVDGYLLKYGKKLNKEQLLSVLERSQGVLWLVMACEVLRQHATFPTLTQSICSLPSTLTGLVEHWLRITREYLGERDGVLFQQTLCLLSCCRSGLLEVEILELLWQFDEEHENTDLIESTHSPVNTSPSPSSNNIPSSPLPNHHKPRLSAWRWACVYRHLQPFLRPYGPSAEGRLYFYHQSVAMAVKKTYVDAETRRETHQLLSNYFGACVNIDRRIEEYPFYLMQLEDINRMKEFLSEWPIICELYHSEFSESLLVYWRFVKEDYSEMERLYGEMLKRWQVELTVWERVKRLDKIYRLFEQASLLKGALEIAMESLFLIDGLVAGRGRDDGGGGGDDDGGGGDDGGSNSGDGCADSSDNNGGGDDDGGNSRGDNDDDTRLLNVALGDNGEKKMKLERMHLHGFLGHIHATLHKDYKTAINLHTTSLLLASELLQTDSLKSFRALQLNKKAFCMGQKLSLQSSNIFNRHKRVSKRLEALKLCHKAQEIYHELKDQRHYMEAKLTQASLSENHQEIQEILTSIISESSAMYGPHNRLALKAHYNMAVDFEETKNYRAARECFQRCLDISTILFGASHPRTLKYQTILTEGKYANVV